MTPCDGFRKLLLCSAGARTLQTSFLPCLWLSGRPTKMESLREAARPQEAKGLLISLAQQPFSMQLLPTAVNSHFFPIPTPRRALEPASLQP